MKVRREVIPFVIASGALALPIGWGAVLAGAPAMVAARIAAVFAAALACYMLYFFRDPERVAPADGSAIVAGADGTVMRIAEVNELRLLNCSATRISIFLSLFDVHVNRSPIEGTVKFLEYRPGKRFFTFQEKSSEMNQHNAILIENYRTRCLVNQIVGPFCRRVVHWLNVGQTLEKGERIGMMKFGSRLDMYFPKDDIEMLVRQGQTVRAGETIVAVLKERV